MIKLLKNFKGIMMVVTRFAPSPTGYLHIGGLRTALFCYLWARKNNGKFLLRIEDTDLKRNSKEATKAIIEAFDWVGLEYDGEAVYQSERFDIYKTYIQKLLDEKKAYYCYMTQEELDELRQKQSERKERPKYDGRYRDFTGTPPANIEPVVRIKAPIEGKIELDDGVKGKVTFEATEMLDDFIIARSDGTPTYNFVVAVDDALMGVTDVIRGDDHLSNTPKQIVVYEALGFKIPKFFHVPMILGPDGKKLSKRDGATDVMEYKNMGYNPNALLNFLARLGWSYGDQEIFAPNELLELFDPSNINKSASAYNADKLLWLNSHYIKNSSIEEISKKLEFFGINISNHDKKEILIDALKDRAKTYSEFAQMSKLILETPISYDEHAVEKFIDNQAKNILSIFLKELENTTQTLHLPCDFEDFIKDFMERNSIKLKSLAQPLRISLVGSTVSPSIYDVMSIVGKDELCKRIDLLLKTCEKGTD